MNHNKVVDAAALLALAQVLETLKGRSIRIVRYDDMVLRGRFTKVKSSKLVIYGKEVQVPEAIIYDLDGELIEAPFAWIKSVELGDDVW